MAKWIWKFGEYETYHNLLLHNRRLQYGYPEPPVWKLYAPEPVVRFKKTVTTEGGTFQVHACGNTAVTVGTQYPDIYKYGGKKEIVLNPGTTDITVIVSNYKTFPSLYIDGVIETDETWVADDFSGNFALVGSYNDLQSPEIFPFQYKAVKYTGKEYVKKGVLFDFGEETFAKTIFSNLKEEPTRVNFGESREEALDDEWSVIHFTDVAKEGKLHYPAYAFRYLYVENPEAEVTAEYEYLPLEKKGSFHCKEEVINRVWDMAAYTFHLNSREFILDGIKRDRWVWSADAYQSLFVNHYLFFNPELEKRTLIALGGKKPFVMHINGIVDYTLFWFISIWEYYKTYADLKFLNQIFEQAQEVMSFVQGRIDEDGFLRGKDGDWVFIDWAPMDKTGAVCGEQILLAKAMECYGAICKEIGVSSEIYHPYEKQASDLQTAIFKFFYDQEKEVFIDSYESGKHNITRHSNILAYLFLPCSEKQKKSIYENVIQNDNVAQITTPYFKFYENQVHCEAGNQKKLEESIRDYYGAMLETGATTLYEEFDPKMKGTEHYAMYGNPYEKSLCHAWSASPIYLLGAYRLGVRNTGIGYQSFEVAPNPGDMGEFEGTVPVLHGEVMVQMTKDTIVVKATTASGTLKYKGAEWKLTPGEAIKIAR